MVQPEEVWKTRVGLLIVSVLTFHLTTCSGGSVQSGSLQELHTTNPDDGELVHMKFKTMLKSVSELITRDYHIIQIPLGTKVVDIHLVRNVELVHSSVVEDGTNVAFHGTFQPNGSVALTATLIGDEEDLLGFSGHIIQGSSHLILHPLSHKHANLIRRTRSTASNQNGSIVSLPHKLYEVGKLTKNDSGSHSDAVIVPGDILKKAIQEMRNSELLLDSSTTTEGPEAETVEGVAEEDDDDDADLSVGNTLAEQSTKKNKNVKTKVKTKNGKAQTKKKNAKPGTNTGKIVELAIFGDAELVKVWESRYPKEGKKRLRGYILGLINNMNLFYQQPSLGVKLSFRIVHLELNPTGLDSPDTNSVKLLDTFSKFAGGKNVKGNKWDHALLLTGHDLGEGIVGTAWMSSMCLKDLSISISEGLSFQNTFTITHEIGHSLGIRHDGVEGNEACDKDKFIMAAQTGPGQTGWSKCSSTNIKDFMTKGSSEIGKEDTSAIPACLNRLGALKNQQIKFASGKLPGQIHGLKEQCRYGQGPEWSPTFKTGPEEVCDMLYCTRTYSDGVVGTGWTHAALEGSPCGKGKYCRHGKCVKIPAG